MEEVGPAVVIVGLCVVAVGSNVEVGLIVVLYWVLIAGVDVVVGSAVVVLIKEVVVELSVVIEVDKVGEGVEVALCVELC